MIQGLSESEVTTRRQRGEGNDVEMSSSRTYGDIIRHNVFNFINIIVFSIGAILVLLGRPQDAFFSAGLIVLNVIIGVVQEIRAKRKLDEIAVLTRPKVTVIREGQEKSLDPSELVLGDILAIRPGDQMVVDGQVVGDGQAEVDESLLTGESDLVVKREGDSIYSGSFCVTGTALYEAQQVGADSFANKLTASARKFEVSLTPMQSEINLIIRLLVLLAAFLAFLLFVSSFIYELPLVRSAQNAAVLTGLIPNGLLFMIILSYALGAVRMAGKGALVQQSNAVEALSHVKILCTDKTGTLTANKINFQEVYPLRGDAEALRQSLATFASSASVTNKTGEAIVEALGEQALPTVDEVTFSSARKWSALAFDGGDNQNGSDNRLHGAYVLGAWEMLRPNLAVDIDLTPQINRWADQGLRVLLFAYNPEVTNLHDGQEEPSLPPLTPLGLISFGDELRPNVKETIEGFAKAGINLKVISGDSPDTVAALAIQAGLPGDLIAVSGTDLATMGDGEFAQMAEESTVFGRITPEQKEKLVDTLKQRGHYVAMIGDGVNDVLSLKKANVGIAMQSGSGAARGVADMILLNDSFSALVPAFLEGQRIVSGMGDILRLFLSRTFSVALIILATGMIRLPFPTVPAHEFLYSLVAVGIPTFFLALWAKPKQPKQRLFASVLPFVIPANILIMMFGLIIFAAYYFGALKGLLPIEVTAEQIANYENYAGFEISGEAELKTQMAGMVSRSALSWFNNLVGILLLIFVAPPIRFFVGGRPLGKDIKPALLAILLFVLLIAVFAIDPLRRYFELIALRTQDYAVIAVLVIIWMFILRMAWRRRWFPRFLQIDFDD